MLSTHQVDADGCASSRSICDSSRGSSHPRAPEVNVECRTRNHASASKWSMDQMIGRVLETIELKAREAWLGWHKTLLKTRGVFK